MRPDERERLEAECEAELEQIGYAGDAKTYRTRLAAIACWQARGIGPGAALQRFLARCGR